MVSHSPPSCSWRCQPLQRTPSSPRVAAASAVPCAPWCPSSDALHLHRWSTRLALHPRSGSCAEQHHVAEDDGQPHHARRQQRLGQQTACSSRVPLESGSRRQKASHQGRKGDRRIKEGFVARARNVLSRVFFIYAKASQIACQKPWHASC